MKIAFRKNPKGLISKSVCWWTKSPYYHCELVFSSSYSFSAVPEKNKVRFEKLKFDDNWDIIDLPFDKNTEYDIMSFCIKEKNCKYDFKGIVLTQILPLSVQSKNKWFCSEICIAALQIGGWFKNYKPYRYNPGELYLFINEKLNQ